MARRKVKLAFIVNDFVRKATFKKRKKSMLNKVDALSTLCGIEACAIIYSPYDPQSKVWPSPLSVQSVLAKFRTMPKLEQSKKVMNQETFLKQRIHKAKKQAKKQRRDNREKEMTFLMFQSPNVGMVPDNNMTMNDVDDIVWLIDQDIKYVHQRLETLKKKWSSYHDSKPTLYGTNTSTSTNTTSGKERRNDTGGSWPKIGYAC